MTTQPQSRTTFPVRPFAIVAVVAIGVAVGMTFAWYRGSDDSNDTTTSTALAPWVRPAGPNAVESLAVEKAIRESGNLSTAVTGTLAEHDNAITGALGPAVVVIPSTDSGRTYDAALADALAQHDNAFPPIKESPLSGIVLAPVVPAGQTFDEAMAEAVSKHGYPAPAIGTTAVVPTGDAFDAAMADGLAMYAALLIAHPQAPERKLSPTGVNGFRDFDPEQVGPYIADR